MSLWFNHVILVFASGCGERTYVLVCDKQTLLQQTGIRTSHCKSAMHWPVDQAATSLKILGHAGCQDPRPNGGIDQPSQVCVQSYASLLFTEYWCVVWCCVLRGLGATSSRCHHHVAVTLM